MSPKAALLWIMALGGAGWYIQTGLEARDAANEKKRQYTQQVAVSEFSQDTLRKAIESIDDELQRDLLVKHYGIRLKGMFEWERATILSLNTPYSIGCSEYMPISVSFGWGEEAAAISLDDYEKDLPFLPESVAGQKLKSALCEHTAMALHKLLIEVSQ